MGGAYSAYGVRGAYRVLVGEPRERDRLEDRFRWEDNIKMDLQEVG